MDRVLSRRLGAGLALAILAGAAPGRAADPSDVARGSQLYDLNCSACHSVAPTLKNKMGPSLFGVVGRKVGAAAGYAYSPAMTDNAAVWTPEALDAYLADPQAAMPGNKMKYDTRGLKPEERAALIAFLGAQQP